MREFFFCLFQSLLIDMFVFFSFIFSIYLWFYSLFSLINRKFQIRFLTRSILEFKILIFKFRITALKVYSILGFSVFVPLNILFIVSFYSNQNLFFFYYSTMTRFVNIMTTTTREPNKYDNFILTTIRLYFFYLFTLLIISNSRNPPPNQNHI